MTVEQVAVSLIVAIVTAFATSVLNNFFELRRLQTMWKQETDERIANYRKERLQERLASIDEFLGMVLGLLQPADVHPMIGHKKMEKLVSDAAYSMNAMVACALAVGDEQLAEAMNDLDSLSGEFRRLIFENKVTSQDTEWHDLSERIAATAAKAFKRIDDLLVQVYAQSVRHE
jgi:hypothetical protein